LTNDDFLPIYFIFARFCEFQKLFGKIKEKEILNECNKGTDVNKGRFVLNIDYCALYNSFEADRCVYFK
jgi:hypothetical protein